MKKVCKREKGEKRDDKFMEFCRRRGIFIAMQIFYVRFLKTIKSLSRV